MEEKTTKKQYFFDGAEITNDATIAYCKQLRYVQKLQNSLLGEFDGEGKYVVANDMLKELCSLKKTIAKTEQDKIFLNAKCGKQNIAFVAEIGNIDAKTKYATLKLVENFCAIFGGEKTEMVSVVAYYKDENNIYFEQKVRKAFGIVTDEGDGKEIDNQDIALLASKNFSNCKKHYDILVKQTKADDRLYVKRVLKLLGEDEFGQFALRRYAALLKQYEKLLDPKSDNYYHILKQILDEILLKEEKSISKQVALTLQSLQKEYVQSIDQVIEVAIKNPPKKVEEKPIKLKGTGGLVFKPTKIVSKPKAAEKPAYRTASDFGQNKTNTSVGQTQQTAKPTAKTVEQQVETPKEQVIDTLLDEMFDVEEKIKKHSENEYNRQIDKKAETKQQEFGF